MPSALLIRIIVLVASAVFVGATWVVTGRPDTDFLRYTSLAVMVVVGGFSLWEHWVWRFGLAQKIKRVPPNISGTWRCSLRSSYRDPLTNELVPERIIFLVIRQTFSTLRIDLLSSESDSESTLARLRQESSSWVVHYIYTNTPTYSVRERSEMHHGSGVLKVVGRPSIRLTGGYWTDRHTRGEITSIERARGHADDYEEAVRLLSTNKQGRDRP